MSRGKMELLKYSSWKNSKQTLSIGPIYLTRIVDNHPYTVDEKEIQRTTQTHFEKPNSSKSTI